MKKLKYGSRLILGFLVVAFALASCQKEDINLEHSNHAKVEPALKIVKLTNKDITQNKGVTNKLNFFIETLKTRQQNKTVYSSEYDFYINTDFATYIEKANGSHSYTFPVQYANETGEINNLVLHSQEDGTYNALYVSYDVTENEKALISNGTSVDLEGKVSIGLINDATFIDSLFSKVVTTDQCLIPIYSLGACDAGSTYYHDPEPFSDGNGMCSGSQLTLINVSYDMECLNAADTGSPGSDGTSSTGDTGNSNGNPNGGGLNYNPNDPVTTPVTCEGCPEIDEDCSATLPSAFNGLSTSSEAICWLASQNNTDVRNILENYLSETQELEFASELVSVMFEDVTVDIKALNFILAAEKADKIYNNIDEEFLISVNGHLNFSLDDINNSTDPIVTEFIIRCAVTKALHPDWNDAKVYWEVSKDFVHLFLDLFGLVPGFGEPADIINGAIYTIEGDALNASLSYASAIPFVGWLSAGTKISIKVVNQTTQGVISLIWKTSADGFITFGNRNILKHVIGTAGTGQHAHHIIPWAKSHFGIIQKAANSAGHFNMNSVMNGIGIPPGNHLTGHAAYSTKIQDKLELLEELYPDMTNAQAFNLLEDFTGNIKQLIQNNPTLNLGQIAELIP